MAQTQDILALSVREFAAATAAKTPTPGGGSVAGVVGALAAGLGEMALAFTRGKKSFAQYEDVYQHLAARLARARGMFEDLVADDMTAFSLYQEATKQTDPAAKASAMDVALAAAIDVPRESAKLALAVMEDLKELSGKCNPHLVSDVVAGAALAVAVVQLADYNVRINARNLSDSQAAEDLRKASAEDVEKARRHLADINAALQ